MKEIGPYYDHDKKKKVLPGDTVLIDCVYRGRVVEVLSPGTLVAKDYSCYQTGGLLIDMEEFGLTAFPFGTSQEIKRVP